jgi:hypothetical protein
MTLINNCSICDNKLESVLNLGKHPLCDDLKRIGSKKKNKSYLIEILFCNFCKTAFQKKNINKKILFHKDYHYRSKLTKDVTDGMKNFVQDVLRSVGSLKNKVVVDIGSNDGSLLDFFHKKGAITVGVEPTGAALETKDNHIIYNTYFDKKISIKIIKKFKKIDIITFTNVFAHVDNINELISNLKIISNNKTILAIENHYLGSVLEGNQFDTFYHEHPRTYSLHSFISISEKINMNIFKYNFPRRYGGNIRVLMSGSKNRVKISKKIIKKEKNFKKNFSKLAKFVNFWKVFKKKEIIKLVDKYGALSAKAFPGRAAILITLLGLNKKIIKTIYEQPTSKKIGYFAPGTQIPIKSDTELFKKINKIKVLVNFAWHISKEIRMYLKQKNFDGKLINILDGNRFNARNTKKN